MRRAVLQMLALSAGVLVSALAPGAAAAACTTTWTGGAGAFAAPAGWSAGVPDASDTACIAAGTVDTTGVDAAVGGLELSGGALAGAGSVAAGALTWTGGDLGGSVRVRVAGPATIDGAAARTLAGTARLRLDGPSTMAAPALATAGGSLEVAGALRLAAPGTWTRTAGSGALRVLTGGSLVLDHPGTSALGWPLVLDGTLDLRHGLLDATGALTLSPSALVQAVLAGTTPGTGYGQLRAPAGARLDGRLRGAAVAPFAVRIGDAFRVVLLAGPPARGFLAATGTVAHGAFGLRSGASAVSLVGVFVPPATDTGNGTSGDDAIPDEPRSLRGATACDRGRTRCYVLLGADAVRTLRGDPAWLEPGSEAALATALCGRRRPLLAAIGGCDTLRRLLAAAGREGLALDLDFAAQAGACFGAYLEPRRRAVIDDLRYAVLPRTAFGWAEDGVALPTGLRCTALGPVWRVARPVFADGATRTPAATTLRARAAALAPAVTLLDRPATKGYRLRLVARRTASGTVLDVRLRRAFRTSSQEHVFELPLRAGALAVPAGLGGGRLVAGLGRYGRVDLVLRATGAERTVPAPAGCSGPGTRTRAATASGVVVFTPPVAKGAVRVVARLRLAGAPATLADPAAAGPVTCPPAEAYDGEGPLPAQCVDRPRPGDVLATFQTAGSSPASIVQLRVRPGRTTLAVATTAVTRGVAPARAVTHTITSTASRARLTGTSLVLTGPVRARLRVHDEGGIPFASPTCRTVWAQSQAIAEGAVGATYDLLGRVRFDPSRAGDDGIIARIRRH